MSTARSELLCGRRLGARWNLIPDRTAARRSASVWAPVADLVGARSGRLNPYA